MEQIQLSIDKMVLTMMRILKTQNQNQKIKHDLHGKGGSFVRSISIATIFTAIIHIGRFNTFPPLPVGQSVDPKEIALIHCDSSL